ncbi:MAG: MarR family transcriptional regulator [Lewinellaceae bacterium]|nr:MarR family transcriptional regulator [Lewinellaceae bacterium]MCB9266039.1 MarR family transcriptional regulator [Lewinellaceae bacterium]
MKNEFLTKYQGQIQGTLSCYDRVVIRGTLHSVSHAGAMTNLLYRKNYLLKDYSKLVNPLRNKLHQIAKQISQQEQVPIEVIRKSREVRKEDLVAKHLQERGSHNGLVIILSAMEQCKNYVYAFDKSTGRSYLKMTGGKCTHYYYYFIDEELGLCYLRVPTWCPFQLQFYFNAHNWLARQLDKAGIGYELRDNAFVHIADYEKAQQLAGQLDVRQLHKRIDHYASQYCPVAQQLCHIGYHWSIMQLEYATDIIFKDDKTLAPVYDEIIKNVMHTVTPDDVARFLGRKYLHGKNNLELTTAYKQSRQEMRRLKHQMGACSVKIYDKFGQVLRIETTTNNTSEFYHYRSVGHRDGTTTSKVAPVKKSIYSLKALIPIMRGCNNRYAKYIAAFDAPIAGKKRLDKITKSTKVNQRTYRGFNFFDNEDENLLRIIAKPNFIIKGFRNKDLRKFLTHKSTGQVSRIIKRLFVKGLIKKVNHTYRYYLTTLGLKVITTALKVKELFVVQELNYKLAS